MDNTGEELSDDICVLCVWIPVHVHINLLTHTYMHTCSHNPHIPTHIYRFIPMKRHKHTNGSLRPRHSMAPYFEVQEVLNKGPMENSFSFFRIGKAENKAGTSL